MALVIVALLKISFPLQVSVLGVCAGVGHGLELEADHVCARISGPVTSLGVNSGICGSTIRVCRCGILSLLLGPVFIENSTLWPDRLVSIGRREAASLLLPVRASLPESDSQS